jgi:uncharacterized protein
VIGSVRFVKHVDLVGLHRDANSGAPLVLLREQDAPYRVLPILVGRTEAAAIVLALRDERPPRPLTHDLMAVFVDVLDAHVERVEVTELRDGAFVAELAMSGPTGERRLDSRPSDAIALAVRVDAPLYVSAAVLDEAGAILTEAPDAEAIDEEVARFRSFLDAADPTEFSTDPAGEPPGPAGQSGDVDRPHGDSGSDDAPDA